MWITGKTDQTSQRGRDIQRPVPACPYLVRNKIERLTREERKDIVSRLREGCAPLFVACKKGNSDIRGVYEVTDDRSIHFVTPAVLAVVKQLIDYGANVNSVSDSGSTPVRLGVVMYLVNHGADILKPNYNGRHSVSLCRFLLRRGADVNAQDVQLKDGAALLPSRSTASTTTRLLLEQSANPFLRSRYGDDALQTACLKGAAQIYEYLVGTVEYGAARRAEADELMGTTFLDEHPRRAVGSLLLAARPGAARSRGRAQATVGRRSAAPGRLPDGA
ncbi:hypothetical protein HPB48_017814 [Haemaphysalis longicornis]|uniref:Uncharacterized protein n=1 Tax=Haemaphysalis longicornis TaxID=44386 RepID=A0A9J6FKB6_HAELO|nr:hypothetical protein HPB48_017814 [Haemaphysalis longicornis]